jgi:integrase
MKGQPPVASVFKFPKNALTWTVVYTDQHGKRRKKKGYTDKRESERLGMKLEERARKIRNGDIDPKDEKYREHEAVPLVYHLEDFKRSVRGKGATPKHIHMIGQRAGRVLDLANAKRISDLALSKALEAVQALRDVGLSQQSINHHIRAVKGFSRWLWSDGRAREHHLGHLATSNPEVDRRHVRRLLTPEEAAKVVHAAETGPEVGNLSGQDRAILYRLALGTGFRANELRTLTPERFNLDSGTPTVTGRSCYTKNGKEAVQPISAALANRLRPWLADKALGTSVFDGMTKRTAEMIRVDLQAAGIPYETDEGVADFHSLRGDFISYLVSSGASVKTCQTLARHSTPSLTIGIYAKASLHDINGAVEGLPDLTAPATEPETLRMTGTDGIVTRSATQPLDVASDERTQVECVQHVGPRGGMADASVLGAGVRKDVGVRLSPRPLFKRKVILSKERVENDRRILVPMLPPGNGLSAALRHAQG